MNYYNDIKTRYKNEENKIRIENLPYLCSILQISYIGFLSKKKFPRSYSEFSFLSIFISVLYILQSFFM